MVVGGCLWRSDLDRELTWQIKQVVLEAKNFTSILPSLRIFSLKTYEISDL